jgi:lipid A 4'-phosphatase
MRDQVLWRLLVATALVHLVFAIWPGVDIAVSRAFLQTDGSFLLANSAFGEDIRMPIWLASVAVAVAGAVMLCASLLRGRNAQSSWRLWAFVTALYVCGTGLLVNVLLKQNWGRARPVTIQEFGGDRLFTPPFEIAGQCSSNCSFVSGEAASAAAMAIVIAVCFGRALPKPWRGMVYGLVAAVYALAAGMRVAAGRHFLSDVVFAGLFMLILARLFYRAFGVTRAHSVDLPKAIFADLFGWMKPKLSAAPDTGSGSPVSFDREAPSRSGKV